MKPSAEGYHLATTGSEVVVFLYAPAEGFAASRIAAGLLTRIGLFYPQRTEPRVRLRGGDGENDGGWESLGLV